MKPKFDITQTPTSFVIAAFIPGMKKEDIQLHLDRNRSTLTIEGIRVPTKQEEKQMRMMIRRRLQDEMDPYRVYKIPEEQEDQLLLRAGAGRYGKFSESYELPPHLVDASGIQASYEKGVLKIEIPKIRAVRKPPPQQAWMHPAVAHPLGGFFGDNDFWW